jgi:hypothetical protein
MEIDKVGTILEKLVSKVGGGEDLDWKQIDNFRFGLKLGNVWVAFRQWQPEDPFEEETIFIEFMDKDADTVIESFSDTELSQVLSSAYQKMKRLWKTAKMRATGFDNVLDDVIGNIDSL